MQARTLISTLLISLAAATICPAASAQPLLPTTDVTPVTQQAETSWHPQALFTFSEGSLKENIEHAAKAFGWSKVVWQPRQDYQWVGQTKIAASGLTDLLTKVLENYPLQAVFYEGNHVLVITARNIR